MIYVRHTTGYVPINFTKYPDGTLHVPNSEFLKISDFIKQTSDISLTSVNKKPSRQVKINLLNGGVEELLVFLQVVKELKCHTQSIRYLLGYLPYARDDKSDFSEGVYRMRLSPIYNELFALLGIGRNVEIYDPHSPDSTTRDTGYGAINVVNKFSFGEDLADYAVIVPDKGARTRSSIRAEIHNNTVMFYCSKVRTPTGVTTILPQSLVDSINAGLQKFVIYDDICDGGATFIGIAAEVRKVAPKANIILCVTHGLFTKGVEHLLTNGIDEVRCLNTLHQFPNLSLTTVLTHKA